MVDDIHPALPDGPQALGIMAFFLLMGTAGFISSAVGPPPKAPKPKAPRGRRCERVASSVAMTCHTAPTTCRPEPPRFLLQGLGFRVLFGGYHQGCYMGMRVLLWVLDDPKP